MTDPTSVLELIELPADEWQIACDHYSHRFLSRGHSDTSEVMAVAGIPLSCCGLVGQAHFMCLSYIVANPFLRCRACNRNSIPFEDCYTVLGPANESGNS